jgi:cyclic dehypoxanthinyl futalosine synthase
MSSRSVTADKIERGQRLSFDDGLELLESGDLLQLGDWANRERFRRFPEPEVTFVVDTNPNYTNVCDTDCTFCAFYRRPGEEGAYTLSPEELGDKLERAAGLGATRALIQGGHNPELPLDYYLNMIAYLRRRLPKLALHLFSAPEIRAIAGYTGMSVRDVLQAFWDAGLRTLPGGGAEILTNEVRRKISVKKGTPAEWLDVHRQAHHLGYRTTATMMFGHLETDRDIVEHLDRLRDLQDETGGFFAFIPWSFKRGATPLSASVKKEAGAGKYLRILALARLYLDNFDHIQGSWFSEGKKTGQLSLHFGADDFGGTLIEENVLQSARWVNQTSTPEVVQIIQDAGFVPVERSSTYERIVAYPAPTIQREFNQNFAGGAYARP